MLSGNCPVVIAATIKADHLDAGSVAVHDSEVDDMDGDINGDVDIF